MQSIWNLGFRPFFLLGALVSVLQILLWSLFQMGSLSSLPLLNPTLWHAHEMIFGYSMAIIAGFLLTASQNWTGIPGVKGIPLQCLVLLWTLARVLAFFWKEAPILFALVDLAFAPALALSLTPYLWRGTQRNNWVFFPVLFLYFVLNLFTHLNIIGLSAFPARSSLYAAVYLTLFLIALVGGRVIPFFTKAVLPSSAAASSLWLDISAACSLAAFAVASVLAEFSLFEIWLAFLAAFLHGARAFLWCPWQSRRIPVLFVLHVAYLWLPIGLALKGLSSLGFFPPSVALHALTAGCIGTIIYGMITRVALGHSGRPIRPQAVIVLGYFIVTGSALARVAGPLLLPQAPAAVFAISGALWVVAHLIFIYVYAPILWSPRADGRPG